jgi:hypothetical protein
MCDGPHGWFGCFGEQNGSAMAQVVSHQPLTTDTRVQSQGSQCGICGGQSGTGTSFSPSTSIFTRYYKSTVTIIPPMPCTHLHLSPTLYDLTKTGECLAPADNSATFLVACSAVSIPTEPSWRLDCVILNKLVVMLVFGAGIA